MKEKHAALVPGGTKEHRCVSGKIKQCKIGTGVLCRMEIRQQEITQISKKLFFINKWYNLNIYENI